MVNRAINASKLTGEIRESPVFGRGNASADWESMEYGFENLESATDESQKPMIITSLGGSEDELTIASAFNVIPALELAQLLKRRGVDSDVLITSAAEYAVVCNGYNREKVLANWDKTKDLYSAIVSSFFPSLGEQVEYELLDPSVRIYPAEIEDAIQQTALTDEKMKDRSPSDNNEDYGKYMASHIQAFKDFQPDEARRFVIKVGAQTEKPFSAFQKKAIETCLPEALALGTVPNLVIPQENRYGQITLLYPRVGSRPPYYKESGDEPGLDEFRPLGFDGLIESLVDRAQVRYRNLRKALAKTSIEPNDYLSALEV